MAVRIRKDGSIVCAAITSEVPGDTYLDDTVHHELSSRGLLVSEPEPEHSNNGGLWWWSGNIPCRVKICKSFGCMA
jgi:hypothetical protein